MKSGLLIATSIGAAIANSAGGLFAYDFQITLKLKTRVTDYEDEHDVQSIVDNAFYQTVGVLPNSSVITHVQIPGHVDTTTAPEQSGVSGGIFGTSATSDTSKQSSGPSFWDTITTFLKGAGVGGFLGIGLALVAIVLIVGLVTSKKIVPGA